MVTNIMIVDDEQAIGRLLIYQLHECGYRASYVSDGLMALERFTRERPDLVLLDVMMPAMSGWEVCRQIRAVSQVPIIMLTAKRTDADVAAGLQAGADDYLGKPFSIVELKARIEAVLRRVGRTPTQVRGARPETFAPTPPIAKHHGSGTKPLPSVPVPAPAQPLRLGPHLREVRLAWGVSLHQAAIDCHTRWEYLQAIEQENFGYVPRPKLREALHAYTAYLGLNLQTLVAAPALPAPPRRASSLTPYATTAVLIVLLIVSLLLLRV